MAEQGVLDRLLRLPGEWAENDGAAVSAPPRLGLGHQTP
jgi:hypothetical protein